MGLLTILLMFLTTTAFTKNDIVGGSDVPLDNRFSRSVIALLTEYKKELKVTCTGTLVAPRVALTAAHCLDSIVSTEVLASQGENPLIGPHVKVTHLLYFRPQFWNTVETSEDVAVLVLEKEFPGHAVALLSPPNALKTGMPVVQLGYGLQTFSPLENYFQYPRYGKLQMLDGKSKVSVILNQRIETTSSAQFGVMGGDSGGPLFTSGDSNVHLHGVLSQGGQAFDGGQMAVYTSPYYFIKWINSVLTDDLQIPFSFPLRQQFPESALKIVAVEDFPSFNRDQCQRFRSGWDIDEEQVCWPMTKESCESFERETVPGEVFWDEESKKCAVST